jgi:hypothetical protein
MPCDLESSLMIKALARACLMAAPLAFIWFRHCVLVPVRSRCRYVRVFPYLPARVARPQVIILACFAHVVIGVPCRRRANGVWLYLHETKKSRSSFYGSAGVFSGICALRGRHSVFIGFERVTAALIQIADVQSCIWR